MIRKLTTLLSGGALLAGGLVAVTAPPASAACSSWRCYSEATFVERHCKDHTYKPFPSVRDWTDRVCIEIAYRRQNDGTGVYLEAFNIMGTSDPEGYNDGYDQNGGFIDGGAGSGLAWADTSTESQATYRCGGQWEGSGPDYDGPAFDFADGGIIDTGGLCVGGVHKLNDKDGTITSSDYNYRDTENKGKETGDTTFHLLLKVRVANGNDWDPLWFTPTAEVSNV